MFYSPEDLQWIWVLQNLPSLLRWFVMERTGVRCGDVLNEKIKCFLGHSFRLWYSLDIIILWCCELYCQRVCEWLCGQNCMMKWLKITIMGPQYSELPTVFCDGYPLTELMRDTNSIHFLVLSYFEHSYILCVQCYVHVICYFSAFSKLTLKLSAHVSRVYLYAQ